MIIFLDIDGVMVPAKSWAPPALLDDGFPDFSRKAVKVLKTIISDDTIVMLTTSHKSRYAVEDWKTIFGKRGIVVHHLDRLPDNVAFLSRKDEILNWFKSNQRPEKFIIIDDDKSLNGLPKPLKDHLVLTSAMVGLTDHHFDELHHVLGTETQTV